jgi:hypothetical protein
MGRPLYTNNAATYLAFGITNTATTMQVSANAGSLFPNPTGGDYFYVSLISLSGPIIEIVKCTARSGDIFTIERGQEGTSPLYWNMGDNVQLRITAAGMNYIAGAAVQSTEEQVFTATQGQTVFTLTNFDYAPGTNNLAVFVNGSKQVYGTNYSETSVNTVTFNSGLNAGDIVEFLVGISVASGTLYANEINYNEGGVGAVTTTVQAKLQESISVLDFNADPTGTTDSTTAIQAAVNAAYGNSLYFPPGKYKITSAINIVQSIAIHGVQDKVTILLGTQNQNGFVVGDGTNGTRTACGNVSIQFINFNPVNGVNAFTSGSCIFLNYVYGTKIQNCTFYGADATTSKLYTGVTAFQVEEYWVNYCIFTKLLGYGHYTSGSSGSGLSTSDGRIDFCEFINITLDCVYFGAYTEGMTLNAPIAYQYTAKAVNIQSTLYNIFIFQPDFEIDNSSSGVFVNNCSNVQILGGWIGGSNGSVGLSVTSTASGVNAVGVIFGQSLITISGAACQVVGCDVAGVYPLTGSYTGITVASTATDIVITGNKIRQWSNAGINFSGVAGVGAISGNTFIANANDILGDAWSPASSSPVTVSGNSSDFPFAITAATTIKLTPTKNYYQVTGGTNIQYINAMPAGLAIVIQAGAGGITLVNSSGANGIILKGGVNASVPAYSLIQLMCDGNEWLELSRNF